MQANGVGAAGTAASVAAVAAPPPASGPAAGSVVAVHPAKLTRDASPELEELSRGSLLDECFPLETSESKRTKFVRDSLPEPSKKALVGWAGDAKDAVAAEHQISAARAWQKSATGSFVLNLWLLCEPRVGTASLMQALGLCMVRHRASLGRYTNCEPQSGRT